MNQYYTNEELISMVDNKPDATPLERELADRLFEAMADSGINLPREATKDDA